MSPAPTQPFWKSKRLGEMSPEEWESLCDGCGRCCLNKIELQDTGEVLETRVACRLLDLETCRCTDYPGRLGRVPDCFQIDVPFLLTTDLLPKSCAYRRVAEGRDLAWWHPLVSGDPDAVHEAGASLRGKNIVSEAAVPRRVLREFDEHYLLRWLEVAGED